jgi:hypothetical protein
MTASLKLSASKAVDGTEFNSGGIVACSTKVWTLTTAPPENLYIVNTLFTSVPEISKNFLLFI